MMKCLVAALVGTLMATTVLAQNATPAAPAAPELKAPATTLKPGDLGLMQREVPALSSGANCTFKVGDYIKVLWVHPGATTAQVERGMHIPTLSGACSHWKKGGYELPLSAVEEAVEAAVRQRAAKK